VRSLRPDYALIFALTVALPAAAASVSRHVAGHGGVQLRKRLSVNDLIADPGSVEIDWSSLYSISTTNYAMPSAVRFTPPGENLFGGRTEYSLSFDSLTNAQFGGSRVTQFSDSLTAMATIVPWKEIGFAIAPQATYLLRNDSGWRVGAIMLARAQFGLNEFGLSAGWSGATRSSDTNPAGTFDGGVGYGRHFRGSGFVSKLTPHMNVTGEKSTGAVRVISVFEGIAYQATDRLMFDISGQHFGIVGGPPDHQIVIGLTLSLSRTR